jgi:hypothetical protein
MRQLCIDARNGEAKQLTRGSFEVDSVDWSPNCRRIVFTRARGHKTNGADRLYFVRDVEPFIEAPHVEFVGELDWRSPRTSGVNCPMRHGYRCDLLPGPRAGRSSRLGRQPDIGAMREDFAAIWIGTFARRAMRMAASVPFDCMRPPNASCDAACSRNGSSATDMP